MRYEISSCLIFNDPQLVKKWNCRKSFKYRTSKLFLLLLFFFWKVEWEMDLKIKREH
jgi:hypothetical protein